MVAAYCTSDEWTSDMVRKHPPLGVVGLWSGEFTLMPDDKSPSVSNHKKQKKGKAKSKPKHTAVCKLKKNLHSIAPGPTHRTSLMTTVKQVWKFPDHNTMGWLHRADMRESVHDQQQTRKKHSEDISVAIVFGPPESTSQTVLARSRRSRHA